MKVFKLTREQTLIEERVNSLTHFIGAFASFIGLYYLVNKSIHISTLKPLVSSLLFGCSMITMFAASMCYHMCSKPNLKKRLKILDHSAIFLLIAGSYTPFLLITLQSTFAHMLLVLIWTIAILGIVFKLFFVYHFPKMSTICYLIMGWLALVAIDPLRKALPPEGLKWLFYGGACYTVGVLFYVWKKLLFSHSIWHIFVIAGCFCHFIAIFFYVLPG